MFNVLFFWQIEFDFLAYVDLIYVVSHRETIKYMNNMSGNHGLEDKTQKNRARPPGRTLPKTTDDSDMYNRAFPVGNALFLFAGGVKSLLCDIVNISWQIKLKEYPYHAATVWAT